MELLWEREIAPGAPAFFPLDGDPCTFGALLSRARRAEGFLDRERLGPGDSVLLADSISPEFYAVVMALLSRGVTVLLVEPYLPLTEIDSIVSFMQPKLFLASFLGRCWGVRSGAIRRIRKWTTARALCSGFEDTETIVRIPSIAVPADHPGVVTFTSGTTGRSKGVIRTHFGLSAQNHAIRISGGFDAYKNPDLAIFANLVLANLGMGRGTVFVPPRWKRGHLKRLRDLPPEWKPETLSCGPAFLRTLRQSGVTLSMKSIHVGGALSDCGDLEQSFEYFGASTRFLHVYGSSEAEPVAISDARQAVKLSREKGWFQTLYLGQAAAGISAETDPEGLWVTGDHVCQSYIGNEAESLKHKRTGADGRTWHFMGDRVRREATGLWYRGRSFQTAEEFELEQKVYGKIGHSSAFIETDPTSGRMILRGEGILARETELRKTFPEISMYLESKIIRDRRHRSRIDRGASR